MAALEFALMAPALVFLMFGMYDLANGWITLGRLTTATFAVGQVATVLAANPILGANILSNADAIRASGAALTVLPRFALNGTDYSVTLSGVAFTPANCAPAQCVATVQWSSTLLGTDMHRPCQKLTSVPVTNQPTATTLSASAFQPVPILIVDLTYNYVPLFLQSFFGSVPMVKSAYFSPRIGVNSTVTGVTSKPTSDLTFQYVTTHTSKGECP